MPMFEEVPNVALDDVELPADDPMGDPGTAASARGGEVDPKVKLARDLPEDSPERKVASLDSMMVQHQGECRLLGRKWNKEWRESGETFAPPNWPL